MEKQEKKTKVSGVYLVLAALTVLFAVSLVFLHKTAYEGASHGNYTVTTQDKTDEITAPTRIVTLVNVNTATAEELETLTGIGPSLAQAIIDYRAEHGDFTAAEDLLNKVTKSLKNREFAFMNKADVKSLYSALQNERPQTIALVLSYVDADKAAGVIAQLEEHKQIQVVEGFRAEITFTEEDGNENSGG